LAGKNGFAIGSLGGTDQNTLDHFFFSNSWRLSANAATAHAWPLFDHDPTLGFRRHLGCDADHMGFCPDFRRVLAALPPGRFRR
jgi:hypothetical protein